MAKTGRPKKVAQTADENIVWDMTLFFAHRLLTRGVSHSVVAERIGVPVDRLRRWDRLKRPFLTKDLFLETPTESETSVTLRGEVNHGEA